MTIQKGIITALATGALFMSALTPLALADTTVSGNGAVSNNTVTMNNNSSTTVSQNNNADITNSVTSSANTGGNSANFNTGGSSAISTGAANNNTWVATTANANVANLNGCSSCNNAAGVGAIAVTGNGAFSSNNVNASNNENSTTLSQNNNAVVANTVTNTANTGDNSGSFNTGGNTTILTGNAGSNTSIATMANANVASLGGFGNGFGGSALIAGNGAESANAIDLNNGDTTNLNQNNNAFITNEVSNEANTGHNSADFNTDGSVLLATGNAQNNTNIQNMANFNWADLSTCGCTTDGNGNIAIIGNGAFSNNTVADSFGNTLSANENNFAQVLNNAKNHQDTGFNSAGFNTGNSGGPSFLFSGDSQNNTGLSTQANENMVGNGAGFNWNGMNFGLTFDMNAILNQMHW